MLVLELTLCSLEHKNPMKTSVEHKDLQKRLQFMQHYEKPTDCNFEAKYTTHWSFACTAPSTMVS